MPKFSKFFKINAPQSQLDFVDVSTDYDTRVYVDPYAIEIQDDVWSGECSELIRVFFLEVLKAIRAKDNARAQNLMSHLHEPAETFLGVSADEPLGRGVGSRQAMQLISAIKASEAYKTGVLSDLSEMALFVENVGRDKISDLTTNIIRSKLVEYTQQQCEIYGIKTETYNGPPVWDAAKKNWVSKFVNLPRVNDMPVMLVPKHIVRKSLSLDSQEFYNTQITDFLIAEHLTANSSLVQLLKNKTKKVYKKDVRDKHPRSKTMIAETVAKNPHLLQVYKDLAKDEGRMLVNVDDKDLSVTQACIDLAKHLKGIPTGANDADRYHLAAMHILTLCFYPSLIQPHKEWNINDGRKRIDIVYTNAAKDGFFAQRRDAPNTLATMVIVECKNYSSDINNPEIDQLLGRFDNNRGNFGVITCRGIDKPKLVLDKCRDLAKAGRGYIIVLSDDDMLEFLDAKQNMEDERLEELLHMHFRKIIS